MRSRFLLALVCVPAAALLPGAALAAIESRPNQVDSAIAAGREEAAKAALKQLDAESEQVDSLIDSAPTPEEKSAAKARMDVLKERRSELRKAYVKARYEELKADVRAAGSEFK